MRGELADRVYYFFGVQPKDSLELIRAHLREWTQDDLVEAAMHVVAAARILCDKDPEFACPRCCGSGHLITYQDGDGESLKVAQCGVCNGAGMAATA